MDIAQESSAEDPAQPGSFSKHDLNSLPIRAYEGPIRLVNDPEQIPACAEILSRETILGFDTEKKPSFRRGESHPPALLQLAGASEVFIFQLKALGGIDGIRPILENPSVIKTGVAVSDDIKQLNAVWPFTPGGFVEIGTLAKKMGLKHTGLRMLAGFLLGFRISKREQRSNWGRARLSDSQIIYAATDAWVGRELYLHIKSAVQHGTHE